MQLQKGLSPGRLASWLETHHPRRVLFVVGSVLLTTLLVVAATTIWTTREKEIDDAERNLARLSLTLAEQTARTMQSMDVILGGLAERFAMEGISTAPDVRRYLATQDVHDLLAEKILDAPHIVAISIIGADGKVVNFSREWPVPAVNVSDRDYFTQQRDHADLGPYISQPAQSRVSKHWTVYLSRRLNGPAGEFAGVLVGAIETGYFEELYQAVSPGAAGTVSLFRRDGTLLARYPTSEAYIGQSFGGQPLFVSALRGRDAATVRTAESAFDNLARVMSAHVVRNYPLVVNITNTETAILAGWQRQTNVILGTTAASILLIVLSGLLLNRQFDLQARMAESSAEREQANRARAVAEAASKAKSSFLANMSHELRTPLNAIIGFTEMLAGRYIGPLNEKQTEYIWDIATSGHHLLDLINTVLDMSKIEAGRYDLFEDPVDIQSVFDETAKLLRLRAQAGGIDLQTSFDGDIPLVLADRRALLQVMVNLVTNAVNFTNAGGRVTLRAARMPDGTVTLTVSDTGTGIDPTHLAHIFEPFQRSDGWHSRKSGGSGLGLSISKMLVERHEGSLSIESTVGVGTTVTVRLPARRVVPAGRGSLVMAKRAVAAAAD